MIGNYHIKDLLLLIKQGDEKSYAIVYDFYWKKLYYLAYKRLGNQAAAEEVVQEVFITLWNKRKDLDIDCLPSYLAGMVRYGVYHYFASEKALKQREVNYSSNQQSEEFLSERFDNKMVLDKIRELSDTLPEKCGLVFKYNKLDDISLSEVAERLNISQKTAEAHLTKALKLVRLSLRSYMHFFL